MIDYSNEWNKFWIKWIKENPEEANKVQAPYSNDYMEFDKKIIDDKTVVDVGCGIGRVAKRVAVNCHKYYGFDISSFAIKTAEEACPYNTEFIVITDDSLKAYEQKLKDKIDTVIIRQVFIHLGEQLIRKYLKFSYAILAKGGLIESTFYYHPTKKFGQDGIVRNSVIETDGAVTFFEKSEIEKMFKDSNLLIQSIEYTNERYLVKAVK